MESLDIAPKKEDLTPNHQENSSQIWKRPLWRKYCPTWCQLAQAICIALIMLLIWCVLYATLGATAAPGGQLFGMCILVLSSYVGGMFVLKLTTLPALIGMLLVGILFKNVGLVDIQGDYIQLNADLRKVALVIILSRAGLGLDSETMKKHYATVLKLGLIPWIVECVAIAVMTHYVLGLPFLWGFLLGSMIASVSPAVVVPCLFRLREQGYGVAKGIPTLVLAAAGIDDSISVASFGIIHSAVFSESSFTYTIIKGPLSIIIGIGFGIAWGAIAKLIPNKGDVYVVPLRFLFIFCGGLFAVFGSNLIGWGGAGPLAVVACGFTAAIFWSKQGWAVNNNPVCTVFRVFWIIFEPILFAFTGAQVEISQLDPFVVKWATLCLVICLLLRVISTYFVGFGCGLDAKEKIFIGITWMAKATVQAALGAVALDTVRMNPDSTPEEYRYGEILLTTSVLSIILTAPLGALLITVLGPKLLSREETIPICHISEAVACTEF